MCLEDEIINNVALVELPSNYNLCECVFHGKKTLIALLKPKSSFGDDASVLGTINLESLQFNIFSFEDRNNNLEHYIERQCMNME